MKALLTPSSREALGGLLMMGITCVIAFLSALALLAMPLLIWAVGLEGQGVWGLVWILAAVFVIFLNITTTVEMLREPARREFARLLLASGVAAATCPLWY